MEMEWNKIAIKFPLKRSSPQKMPNSWTDIFILRNLNVVREGDPEKLLALAI